MLTTCYVCQKQTDCRPYGEGGKPICRPCMTSDPKRMETGKKEMAAAMQAAAGPYNAPIILGENGPEPLAPEFHAHLDACERCRNQPMNLCPTGATMLQEAAAKLSIQ